MMQKMVLMFQIHVTHVALRLALFPGIDVLSPEMSAQRPCIMVFIQPLMHWEPAVPKTNKAKLWSLAWVANADGGDSLASSSSGRSCPLARTVGTNGGSFGDGQRGNDEPSSTSQNAITAWMARIRRLQQSLLAWPRRCRSAPEP